MDHKWDHIAVDEEAIVSLLYSHAVEFGSVE